MNNTTVAKQYAVVERDGFFRDDTKVLSAHKTQGAAIKAASASKHRVSIPGNQPNQSAAMVIFCADGVAKGETVYGDTIRRLYPVVW